MDTESNWLDGLERGLPDDFDFCLVRTVDNARSLMLRLPNADRGIAAYLLFHRALYNGRNEQEVIVHPGELDLRTILVDQTDVSASDLMAESQPLLHLLEGWRQAGERYEARKRRNQQRKIAKVRKALVTSD